jgi:glutamyl-tRNA synthetase
MSQVRTRFAPSPTGFLHLGGARTALFAWAYARHHAGTFILRVEDTDVERSTPAAVQAILDGMAWLRLDYDEGPFYQMQRMGRYREVIAAMLAGGLAYHCYTTPAELDALRAAQMARGDKPRYDLRWRPERAHGMTVPEGVKPVVRFRNPDAGSVVWQDGVKGRIEVANAELDDLIIARADGTPTYNFCVVVDDLDMRITHVIRGDDHVNNTPRQINILRALGGNEPVYAHLPTVLGEDGSKLSKRHGALSVMQYEADGFLAEAMINGLARVGWSHGDTEIFSREQLVEWFTLEAINPAPSRFDLTKLRWLNQEHMKRLAPEALGARLQPFLARAGLPLADGPDPAAVAALLRERVETLVEMADAAHYYFYAPPPSNIPEKLAASLTDAVKHALADLHAQFATLEWTRESIAAAIKATAATHGIKPPQIMMALRALLAGEPQTPAIDAITALLGRDRVRERMALGLPA